MRINVTTLAGSGDFQYDHIEVWGRAWASEDTAGVGVDSQNQVYILVRSEEHPVVVLNPEGEFIRSWGRGIFKRAHALFVGPDDSIYCVDDRGHSVRKFTPDGRLLLEICTADRPAETGYVPGVLGSVVRPGPPFNAPTGVGVSPEGDLIVSDGYGNARIHRFAPNGKLTSSFGEPGHCPGQFLLPHGVAADRDGRIWVADRENSRIQVFTSDGAFIAEHKAPRASSLFIDRQQNVFVTEMGEVIQGPPCKKHLVRENAHARITVRNILGDILAELLPRDPEGDGLFFAPHSIVEDSAGNLYVSEVSSSFSGGLAPKNHPRLHKFVRVQ
jgi:DNA-binding beta-propeller fold protein YncE